MADRRRALAVLERLRRHEMEEEARALAALRAEVVRLKGEGADLRRRLRDEARIVTIEAAPYVGAYLRAIRAEAARVDAALARAAPRVAALEEALSARFRDLRTVSLALDRARAADRAERAGREAAEAASVALARWARGRSESPG